MNLTVEDAARLTSELKAAQAGETQFLDILMPNGKALGDCTGEYVLEVGVALQKLGDRLRGATVAPKRDVTKRRRAPRAERISRACGLRDAAIVLVRRVGKWESCSGYKILIGRIGSLTIGYRTPFQKLPTRPANAEFIAALHGISLPKEKGYGLDVWAGRKVLSIEWDESGDIDLVAFRPGEWESELLAQETVARST